MWRSGELLAITQQWKRATDVRPVYEACEAVALCRRPTRGVIEAKRTLLLGIDLRGHVAGPTSWSGGKLKPP